MRVGLDGEVAPRARRLEIAARRAHAPAAADRALRHGDAFLVGAVVVGVASGRCSRRRRRGCRRAARSRRSR